MENEGKYALITGATSGIGYELAKLFAQDKYNLVIVARNQEELNQTANTFKQQYGVEVVAIASDLMKPEAPLEVYEEVKAKGLHVDVLVNNAGQGEYGKFAETDLNEELDIIQLNIGACVILTKCFLQDMVMRNTGKILNVSSIAGETPGPWQAVYHGTKAFVTSFTEAIRSENKEHNITFTLLLPGATDTDFFHKAHMEDSKILQSGLADPVKVAKDGYDALMAGDDKIISGFKNKAMVAGSNVMPDSMAADAMGKQQEPSKKDNE